MDDSLRELMADAPDPYAARFTKLAELTDAFCDAHLDAEYKQLCREMAVVVCQNTPSVLRGKPSGWAAFRGVRQPPSGLTGRVPDVRGRPGAFSGRPVAGWDNRLDARMLASGQWQSPPGGPYGSLMGHPGARGWARRAA